MKLEKPELKGYTLVGNIPNKGIRPELVTALQLTHPVLYKTLTHYKNVQVCRARYAYMFDGLRVELGVEAYDIHGKAITPQGCYLAVYVHNKDLNEYNRRYEAAMR